VILQLDSLFMLFERGSNCLLKRLFSFLSTMSFHHLLRYLVKCMLSTRTKTVSCISSIHLRILLGIVNKYFVLVINFIQKLSTLLFSLMQSIPTQVELPVFEIDADAVKIIKTPSDFYNRIKDGIQNSKRKILLASLYIGTSEQEIVDLLTNQLSQQPDLKVSVLLDYFRGTRLDNLGNSSKSLLFALVQKYPKQVSVSFYHSPNGSLYSFSW
jgi:hypothetical protein